MADPLTDLEIRNAVRAKDDPTERVLLMIYEELRNMSLLLYTLDQRRIAAKDNALALDDGHWHFREDDPHWFLTDP